MTEHKDGSEEVSVDAFGTVAQSATVPEPTSDSLPLPFQGAFERVADGRVVGWVRHVSCSEPLTIQVIIDGVSVATGRADQFREDLLNAQIGTGRFGFEIAIDDRGIGSDKPLTLLVGPVLVQGRKLFAVAEKTASDDGLATFADAISDDDAFNLTGLAPQASLGSHIPPVIEIDDIADSQAPSDTVLQTGDEEIEVETALQSGVDAAVEPMNESEDIKGYIEVVDNQKVVGWVYDPNQPERRVTVEVLAGGRVIGEVVADTMRGDLGAAGIGDGAHGFQFPYPLGYMNGKTVDIAVVVKDAGIYIPAKLGISVTTNADNRYSGAADALTPENISGWVMKHLEKDRPLQLAIYLDDQLIGRGRTDKYRKDVFARWGGHGFYGFSIKLSRQIFREDFSSLRLMTIPDDAPIRILPQMITRLKPAPATSNAKPKTVKGYLDRADRETIAGWAVDEHDVTKPTMVDIYVNDMLIRSTVAGLHRADLSALYPDSKGSLGFNYQIPYGTSIRGTASVSARLTSTGRPLDRSPIVGNIGKAGRPLLSPAVDKYKLDIRARQTVSYEVTAETHARVAAIVLNRDGADFLEALFHSIYRHNTYRNLDIVIIDHGSTDSSRAICLEWQNRLNIRFINRQRNYSYSSSNNFGAAVSDAEFLFFLNNDVRFDSDIIARALGYLKNDVGIVGFKLVSPPEQVRMQSGLNRENLVDVGFTIDQVQHLGVRFTTTVSDRPFVPFEEPVNRENDSFSSQPIEVPAVTAAALLVRKEDFFAVGGFHEEYFYGFEDVDFCLTFRELTKKKIVCLNNIKLYHFRSASLQRANDGERTAKAHNKEILLRRVGNYIKKHLKDERERNTSFVRSATISIAFAVSEASDTTSAGDYFTALEIAQELAERHKFECTFLETSKWYDLGDFDVVVAMVDGFRPSLIRSCRTDIVVIAWLRNWFDRWLAFPELSEFDAIWVSSERAHHAFSAKTAQKVSTVRIATNVERFERGVPRDQYLSDYCFTGSYFGSWREIIGFLAPDDLPYRFALFGHGWADIEWLKPYYRGPQPYSNMPDIYASTKIVVDDANHTTLDWGSANSRVFDAIAAGALVITNSRSASDDAFNGLIPVFNSKDTLSSLIKYYLENEDERLDLISKLQAIVRDRHSYSHRADKAAHEIRRLMRATSIAIQVPSDSAVAIEPFARMVEHHFGKKGSLPHVLARPSWRLSKARALGAEIDIRFTRFNSAGDILNILPHRTNVLFVLCGYDEIAQKDVRNFDIVLAPDEEIASVLRQMGCNAKGLSAGNTNYNKALTVERRLLLQQLFESSLCRALDDILGNGSTIQLERHAICPSDGPSLRTVDGKNGRGSTPNPLRIAYVLWDFPALSQTFIINEIRWLVANGYDVNVYYKVEPDRAASIDFELAQFKVVDAGHLAELLTLHGRTIVHSPFAFPATAHLTYPAAQTSGVPFTIMPAGVDISHFDNMRRNRIAEITNSPLCIGVMTIGNYHHRFLLEQGVPNRKIVLERQAVEWSTGIGQSRSKHVAERPKIISIARFVEKKGLRYLIDAASELPECDIVLFGYGPLEGELRSLVERQHVANVFFGGPLDSTADLWKAYDEADIFCLPCVRAVDGDLDGLPTVILEAMVAGVPVVSTNIANVPDVVVEGITGFLAEPKNSEDLVAAIRRALMLDPLRRERIIWSARRKAEGYANVASTMRTLTRVWGGRAIDIILVTYDTGKYKNATETEQIIDRIFSYTSLPFNVYVVDNGSDEQFLQNIRDSYSAFPNFHLIPMGKNVLCGPASNIAIEQGTSDYIIYLCSKEAYVLRRSWELSFVKYMDEHPDVGLAGHLITMPACDGAAYQTYPLFSKFRNQKFAQDNPDRHFAHVQGGVYILRREAFDVVGGFNPEVPQNGMDVEYSYFLESEGWKLGDIPNVYSATTLTLPSVLAMVDENAVVVHPLSASTVGRYDRMVSGSVKSCNICGWEGERFIAEDSSGGTTICPNCNSRNFDRTVMRLLALAPNLQKKPRILAITEGNSLLQVLTRLSTSIKFEAIGRTFDSWPSREDVDLVIISHREWSSAENVIFVEWGMNFIAGGGSLVIGAGAGCDPLPSMTSNVLAQPVCYDSATREFDWNRIYAFNIDVHS